MMPRRDFLSTITHTLMAAPLTATGLSALPSPAGKAPNVLFVFPDQFRLHAMGFWKKDRYRPHLNTAGDPVVTPNLDRFADESVVLTHAVAIHPVCSPFRAMLMSGAFPAQNGVTGNCHKDRPEQNLHSELTCLPEAFGHAGYATGYFGKTHWNRPTAEFDEKGNWLGKGAKGTLYNDYDSYVPPGPDRHGIDTFQHTVKDNHRDPTFYSNRPDMAGGLKDGEAFRPGQFSAKAESERVIAWLRNRRGERDGSKPFFGVWSPNPPHNPYTAVEHVEKEVYHAHYAAKAPGDLLTRPNVVGDGSEKGTASAPFYFSNVTSVDKYFGDILSALREEGLEENTIVVFTADHGEMMGSHGLMGKNNAYDECFRIPFLIRWPVALKPAIAHTFLGPVDMMPTLLGLAGKTGSIPATCRGRDLSKALLKPGATANDTETMPIILGDQDRRGVRSHRYTVVLSGKENKKEGVSAGAVAYDHVKDPYQMKPMALQEIPAADRQHLLKETVRWLRLAGDAWATEKKFGEILPWS